jgi:hypothetical protein
MSKVGDLLISLQEEITEGFLTFEAIAAKYEVPISWVEEAAAQLSAGQ